MVNPENVRVGDRWDFFGRTLLVKKIHKRRANKRTGAPEAITGFTVAEVYKDAFGKVQEGRVDEFHPRELGAVRFLSHGTAERDSSRRRRRR